MNAQDFINNILNNRDLLCGEYAGKLSSCQSKYDIFSLITDANGCSYVLELQKKGIRFPFDTFYDFFRKFINEGQQITHETKNGGKYTTSYYCGLDGQSICLDATNTVVLASNIKVFVPQSRSLNLYIDKTSNVEIVGHESSSLNVTLIDERSLKDELGISKVKVL